jgi:hypothetical protein
MSPYVCLPCVLSCGTIIITLVGVVVVTVVRDLRNRV